MKNKRLNKQLKCKNVLGKSIGYESPTCKYPQMSTISIHLAVITHISFLSQPLHVLARVL